MREKYRSIAIISPALIYMLVIYATPLFYLLGSSFHSEYGLTLVSYSKFFSDPFNWNVIGNTLSAAFVTTLVALLLGYPCAVALSQARGFQSALMLGAIIIPLSIGVVVKAFSWQIVLRRDGVVAQLLMTLGIWEEPKLLLFTFTGLIIGSVNIFLPFMILPIYSVLRLMDPRLGEAAYTLGATPIYRFLHVSLPLAIPGIIAGSALVFSLAIGMYVIPSLLIGDRYQTLSTLTARSFIFMRDEQLGATTAAVLLLIAIFVVVASSWTARRLGGAR